MASRRGVRLVPRPAPDLRDSASSREAGAYFLFWLEWFWPEPGRFPVLDGSRPPWPAFFEPPVCPDADEEPRSSSFMSSSRSSSRWLSLSRSIRSSVNRDVASVSAVSGRFALGVVADSMPWRTRGGMRCQCDAFGRVEVCSGRLRVTVSGALVAHTRNRACRARSSPHVGARPDPCMGREP